VHSLFTWLNEDKERKIYVVDDFSLDVVGQVIVSCQHGKIDDVYHVPNPSSNLLFVTQLTHTGKIVEFWLDQFYVCDLKKDKPIFIGGLYPIDSLYKFRDMNRLETERIALVSHTDERSRIWHDRLRELNFQSLQTLTTQNMVVGLSKVFPFEGVCKVCVLGKHHHATFESDKAWRAKNLLYLVHSDVCCINLPSLEGVRYILTFIDDSHFTWVFFLKNKNLVFEKFKDF
jgi:hypothetical protein